MSDKFLNAVIFFSIIGIVVIGIYKNFFVKKEPTLKEVALQNQQLNPTPKPRAQIACEHPYFNFQPGTSWEYMVTESSSSESETGASATPSANIFLSIVKNEVSSVTLLATDSSGMKKNATITCTDEGLTGLPLQPINNAPIIGTLLFNDYLFLPQDVKKGAQWTNSIFDLKLLSTISDVKTGYIKGIPKKTFNISSRLDTPASANSQIPVTAEIDYDVLEGVGITSMDFNISMGQMMTIKKTYTLKTFRPGI